MKIEDAIKNYRYWGYEPASGEKKDALSTMGKERCFELRRQFKDECRTIKIAGYLPRRYGMSRDRAIEKASALEDRFPDIEMRVFMHDYL